VSKKNHNPGPVPPGNRPQVDSEHEQPDQDESGKTEGPKSETGQEQDEKRRLGEFTGKGEPARQQ
jgi:hypothetical protein